MAFRIRNLVVRLASHPVSAIGAILSVASGCVFLALAILHLFGAPGNPSADIVIFVMLPALFAVGLLLMPVGLWLRRRRPGAAAAGAQAWPTIDLNVPHTRHTVLFFAASTFVGLVALSFASQRAVEYSESQQFCGQTCHQVMGPHYAAHRSGLHGRVNCVACH